MLDIISKDKLKKTLHESNLIVQEIEEAHEDYVKFIGNVNEINNAIKKLDYEAGSTGDDLKIKILAKAEPIIVRRLEAENHFSEFVKIKEQLKQNYEAKNVEEMQKSVENLGIYKNLFVGDEGFRDNAQIAYDTIIIYYNTIKTVKPKDSTKFTDEAKHDEWQMAKNIEHVKQMHGISMDHISKALALKEKIDTDAVDEWNIIENQEALIESQIEDQRKNDIIELIKDKLESKINIGAERNVLKSLYQEVYFHYDEPRFQRFFMWVSDDKDIKGIELSKQLAYILGFQLIDGRVSRNSFATYSPDIAVLHSFYVYSPNLIANTLIGNTYGPLLRVVNVDRSKDKKMVESIYTQEFHHKVLLNQISEIQIQISSDTGRPIEFNWGNCIITLHFKRSLF